MRQISPTLRDAIDVPNSYEMYVKADIYPSRIFFTSGSLFDYSSGTGLDAKGMINNPRKQDIEYNPSANGLTTFWADGTIKSATQGSTTITDHGIASNAKPGVLGSKIYVGNGTTVQRRSITWGTPPSLSGAEASATTPYTIDAVHAVSTTEAVVIMEDRGGFRPAYINGSSCTSGSGRWMYPTRIISSGSGRSLLEQAVFSGAAKLGTKVFAYMSNQTTGMVEGCYYDTETSQWSDIFVVLPTDLDVSQCEFRIANVYEHNGMLYMAGQFHRADNLNSSAEPYTLLLYSPNGRTFSIERNTLVSDIGYRFLAKVGNGKLYLGNCNRICYDNVTWVFDGTSGSGRMSSVGVNDVKSYNDSDLSQATLILKSGLEQYYDHQDVIEGAKCVIWLGMATSVGVEYIQYATYIIQQCQFGIASGKRNTVLNLVNLATFNLTGMSMPFYAEILGKSVMWEPMLEDTAQLTASGDGTVAVNGFQIDMWSSEPFSQTGGSPITGIDMVSQGGINFHIATGAHRCGIITKQEVQDIVGLSENPTIYSDQIGVKLTGWAHDGSKGNASEAFSLVLITEDAAGNETTHINQVGVFSQNDSVKNNYLSGFTVGHKIKKVGVVFEGAGQAWFNIGRIEFGAGVRVQYPLWGADTPWESHAEGYYTIPDAGKPFIMLAARPYDAFNFSLSAYFGNTYDAEGGYDFHIWTGLVGLAESGKNYIAARYDRLRSNAEIVICRDGIETTVATATYAVASNDYQFRFDHRDGVFEVYLKDANSDLVKVLTYEWNSTNGYMYTSTTASMRCGIYGFLDFPKARTLGYTSVSSDEGQNADAIPFDPLFDPLGFPLTGRVKIEDNVYQYTDIIPHLSTPLGPYQFRNKGAAYKPPFGTGEAGLECREWTNYDINIVDQIIALNSGCNFIATGSLADVWITTGGVEQHLPNRARYYSANPQIGKIYHYLAHKVWVVGGLKLPASSGSVSGGLVSGTAMLHREGAWVVFQKLTAGGLPDTGEVRCYWYMGSGGEDDTTVGNMVQKVCDLSGAPASFPGDYTNASLNLTTNYLLWECPYSEGFDLYFEATSFGSGNEINLLVNAKLKPDNYEQKSLIEYDDRIAIQIHNLGSGQYRYRLYSLGSSTVIYSCVFNGATGTQKFRVALLSNNIGLYQNGRWVTTIATDELVYGDNLQLTIGCGSPITLTNIRATELCDWREAIYIDLETDGRSALGSVIQQRPVETIAKSDGSLDFWYEVDRDTLTAIREPREHGWSHSVPSDGASDAIIYGVKDVKTIQNANFARELGFSTKLMRMPDLGMGAIRAANLILKKAFESHQKHNLVIRPDLACEQSDYYHVVYDASGTLKHIDLNIIVEDITVEVRLSGAKVGSRMTIAGRQKYE